MDATNDPLVSICCITYNHEKYIREAIEGFLMQKTDFPYEIIIHDDASTDSTADIIREYEKKYPDIIKSLYQTENQYSKGIHVALIPLRMARGKYVAFCEGDDYWIDPLKLQRQVVEMSKYPECYISFHPSIIKWIGNNREDEIIGNISKTIKIFSTEEVILGSGSFMPTASIMLDRLALPKIITFFNLNKDTPMVDYYIQILGAEHGGALFLTNIMSVYRSGIPGSWSELFYNNFSYRFLVLLNIIKYNYIINNYLERKYSKQFIVANKKTWKRLIKHTIYFLLTKIFFKRSKTIINSLKEHLGLIY